MMETSVAGLSGLSGLGASSALAAGEAKGAPLAARARDAATKFEAIFVQQMVAAMRSSADGIGGGMFGADPGADTYSAWFDTCMSENITRGGGIGLAPMIEKNILQHSGEARHA